MLAELTGWRGAHCSRRRATEGELYREELSHLTSIVRAISKREEGQLDNAYLTVQ